MVYVPRMKNLKKLVPNVNPNLCKNAYWRFTPVDINLLVNFFGSLLLVVVMLSVNKLCTKKRTLLLLSINVQWLRWHGFHGFLGTHQFLNSGIRSQSIFEQWVPKPINFGNKGLKFTPFSVQIKQEIGIESFEP